MSRKVSTTARAPREDRAHCQMSPAMPDESRFPRRLEIGHAEFPEDQTFGIGRRAGAFGHTVTPQPHRGERFGGKSGCTTANEG